jgi:hypothetical protein
MINIVRYNFLSKRLIPEWLNEQINKRDDDQEYFCVLPHGYNLIQPDMEKLDKFQKEMNIGAFYGNYFHEYKKENRQETYPEIVSSFSRARLIKENYIPPVCIIPYNIVDEIGLLDVSLPNLFMWDYYLRISEKRIMFHTGETMFVGDFWEYPINDEEKEQVLKNREKRNKHG